MRLFLLVVLTMTAFAANSILTRMALSEGQIGPLLFSAIRLSSGAMVLALLVALTRRSIPFREPMRWIGVLSLALYMVGFSLAYLGLDTGVGALILFGGVQVTMLSGAVALGQGVPAARWVGAALAFTGLILLLWPTGSDAPSLMHGVLMAAAALGWGIYSIVGQRASEPLAETAANFCLATPIIVVAVLIFPTFDGTEPTYRGIYLAVLSGVVMSGLGYALWYSVLPRMNVSVAALAQLSVPIIAMAGGILFLSEVLTLRFVFAGMLVLGGIAYGVLAPRSQSPN